MPLLDDPWLPAPDDDGYIPAVRQGAPVAVYRYDGQGGYFELPNVHCTGIQFREGTDPGGAIFYYNLASPLDGAPHTIEQALGTQFSGPYVINPGDRLVVRAMRPDGIIENLFDGLVTSFGMDLSTETEEVVVQAIGIAWHAWDNPIPGALMRDADDPTQIDDTRTDLPAQFNAEGLPNCIPDGYLAGSQSGDDDYRYPTFLDPLAIKTPDQRTYWTLAKAARYILYTCNPIPADPSQWFIRNPDGDYLTKLLDAAGNPANSGGRPTIVPDTPITGKDWPMTLYRLVTEVGVGMHFQLGSDDDGNPVTALAMFPQQGGEVKNLYLAPRGTDFAPALFNVASSSLHRDVAETVNQVTVTGALGRVETSLVLACGFPSQSSDAASPTALQAYLASNLRLAGTDTDWDKYRLYVFNETGDGYYDPGSTTQKNIIPSLSALFGFGKRADGTNQYCARRRRAYDCLTLDPRKTPYNPRLAISTNYTGTAPAIWDGTGKWQPITTTTWQVLTDRIGIRITDTNPEDLGHRQVHRLGRRCRSRSGAGPRPSRPRPGPRTRSSSISA